MSNRVKIKDAIAESKPSSCSVPICLRADLVAEYEERDRRLSEAVRKPANSLAGNGSAVLIAEMDEIREQMIEYTYDFRIIDCGRRTYGKILAEHPPRENNAAEQKQGFADSFYAALLRVSIVSPELDDDDWLALVGWEPGTFGEDDPGDEGKLTEAQFTALTNGAWKVGHRDVDVPFSRAASLLRRTSEAE